MSETETLEVVKDFKYAYRGCDVVAYMAGETVELTQEVADLAKINKWVKKPGKKAPAENKDLGSSPENKSAVEEDGAAQAAAAQIDTANE